MIPTAQLCLGTGKLARTRAMYLNGSYCPSCGVRVDAPGEVPEHAPGQTPEPKQKRAVYHEG
jgi:hypothetical protein